MRMEYGLKLDLSQKLIMTPQLRQAIAILQLSSLDLAQMVEQELLENPVLELNDEPVYGPEIADSPVKSRIEEYLDWEKYFNDGTDNDYHSIEADERRSFEAYTSAGVSLQDHLEFQLHLAVLDCAARKIGRYLIGCINENGYLCITTSEAAKVLRVSQEDVTNVLKLIQTFDPSGVGARNLQECLAIQAEQKGIKDKLVIEIINSYLPDVAAGRFKCIADKLGCTPHDIQKAVDIIRSKLDPKPGSGFGGSGQTSYIIPDVTIERVNGEYVIIINDTNVPRLMINPYYRRVVRDTDNETKKFVEGRIHAAVWLIKSIEQRRRTLYSVMEAIVNFQRDFFDYGPKYVKPLTMKKLADRLSIHESTVSRATANKYVDTPHGLFSLRTFFSAGLPSADGESFSASRIKKEIREIIAGEDAGHPLSDQALAEMLSRKGMNLSRRTVAKYREELGIQASSKRKRY